MISTFKEVRKPILFRSDLLCSRVKPTNIGTVPKGFITDNNAINIIINNSISFFYKEIIFFIML